MTLVRYEDALLLATKHELNFTVFNVFFIYIYIFVFSQDDYLPEEMVEGKRQY